MRNHVDVTKPADMSVPDQYGQLHPIETPDLLRSKLKDLDLEIAKLNKEVTEAYDEAQIKCPDLITEEFKLIFLRCELFNAHLAALRLTNYWEERMQLFGPDRAFLPLTQDRALKDDAVALALGNIRLSPGKDSLGRSVIVVSPFQKDKSKYKAESMARSIWYVIHAALENEATQKKGIIFLVLPETVKFSSFDYALDAMIKDSIKGCLPVRIGAMHVCNPPKIFRILVLLFFMDNRVRKHLRIHCGSEDLVLESLSVYGLTKHSIPSELGGCVVLDHNAWLNARKVDGK